MNFNTAAVSVLVLLSAFDGCSAAKDRITGKVVADLELVAEDLTSSHTPDKDGLGNIVPKNYILSLNEALLVSSVVQTFDYDKDKISYLKALKDAQTLDEADAPRIAELGMDPETFRDLVVVLCKVSANFESFETIFVSYLKPTLQLMYENAKALKMFNLTSENVKKILTNDFSLVVKETNNHGETIERTEKISAHQYVVELQNALAENIRKILAGEDEVVGKTEEAKLEGLKGLKRSLIDEQTIEILMQLDKDTVTKDDIIEILVQSGLIDLSIRDADPSYFDVPQEILDMQTSDASRFNNIVSAIVSWKTFLTDVLFLLDQPILRDNDVINKMKPFMKWRSVKNDALIIKAIFFNDEDAQIAAMKSKVSDFIINEILKNISKSSRLNYKILTPEVTAAITPKMTAKEVQDVLLANNIIEPEYATEYQTETTTIKKEKDYDDEEAEDEDTAKEESLKPSSFFTTQNQSSLGSGTHRYIERNRKAPCEELKFRSNKKPDPEYITITPKQKQEAPPEPEPHFRKYKKMYNIALAIVVVASLSSLAYIIITTTRNSATNFDD